MILFCLAPRFKSQEPLKRIQRGGGGGGEESSDHNLLTKLSFGGIMEKMPICVSMEPACLFLDCLVAFLLPWQRCWALADTEVGRHGMGTGVHFGGCRQGSEQAGLQGTMQAAVVAGTPGRTCVCRQAQLSFLLPLLLCFPIKSAAVRNFIKISWSCFGMKDGWSADTCWERGGCGAGEVSFEDYRGSLHSF